MENKDIFVIDIGNTHIVTGVYRSGKLTFSWRFSSDKKKTSDEYFSLLYTLSANTEITFSDFAVCAISSVVPVLTRTFHHLVERYFQCPVINVTALTELDLSFPMPDPSFIGADLIVNAYSALKKYQGNCIVCDFGTATTLQLIGKDGFFHGTIIIPGVNTAANSLFEKASLLTNIQIERPNSLLGTSTKEALLSGIVLGNSLMIDALINRVKTEYQHLGEFIIIATGGISSLICKDSQEVQYIDKNLTLDGLYYICKRYLYA